MLSYTSPVIIALDATPLIVSTGGVARYTSELARALAARFPADEYWLLSDRVVPVPGPQCPNLHDSTTHHANLNPADLQPANLHKGNLPKTFLDRRWWSRGLLREMKRCGAQLFHGTDFSVPYLPLRPSVMTVHDLSPWRNRAWQRDAARVRRRAGILLRARIPTMVITPTEAIRRAVIDRFRFPGDRVAAVPLAASQHFRPVPCPPPGSTGGKPYFLFVGTLEPRKNLATLIGAWREVRKTHDIDLVIVGRTRADFPPLASEPGLRVLGAIPDDDLPELYSAARAVVYPSLYEGFGLPVLEAMQCGAIVVTSRDPAIMEVAADSAILIEAHDPRGLAGMLASIAEAPHNFAPLRERGLRRAKQFSWQRTAELTHEVYAEARRVSGH
jgi:glycosyltransferase involved in cell wall biosynthesis